MDSPLLGIIASRILLLGGAQARWGCISVLKTMFLLLSKMQSILFFLVKLRSDRSFGYLSRVSPEWDSGESEHWQTSKTILLIYRYPPQLFPFLTRWILFNLFIWKGVFRLACIFIHLSNYVLNTIWIKIILGSCSNTKIWSSFSYNSIIERILNVRSASLDSEMT